MITHPFTYQAPATIEEAVQQLGKGDDAKVIAGSPRRSSTSAASRRCTRSAPRPTGRS